MTDIPKSLRETNTNNPTVQKRSVFFSHESVKSEGGVMFHLIFNILTVQ